MIKNMFKRSWLSIYRKPTKSTILMLIMFIMANLVLSALVIKSGVEEQIAYAKETLGSEVYLSADMDSLFQSGMMGQREPGSQGEKDQSSMSSISRPELNINMVLDIANSSYVKDLYYRTSGSANGGSILAYESNDSSFGMGGSRPTMNRGDFSIHGINTMAYSDEITSNILSLYEDENGNSGSFVDEYTDNQVNVSYELAEANGLSIGSIITLINVYTDTEEEFEVIGIFTANASGYENYIYMNVATSSKLLSEVAYNNGDYTIASAVYYLNNPDDFDAFTNEVNNVYDLSELSLTLDIDTTAYDQMAGPIEQVGSFADTILIAVVIASVFIISLMITNSIKDRKYEMGVLMSLGAPKTNIISQIFLELAVVTTIGFVLSIGTSYFIASSLSDSILENQLSIEESSTNTFNRPGMSNTGGMNSGNSMLGGNGMIGSNNNSTSNVDAIDEIEISVSFSDYAYLFLIGYLIAFISMIIPSFNIVKYEPKTILTGRE